MNNCGCLIRLQCLQCRAQLKQDNRHLLEYSQQIISLARQLTAQQVATTSVYVCMSVCELFVTQAD